MDSFTLSASMFPLMYHSSNFLVISFVSSFVSGSEWNPKARNCRAETKPVKGSEYPGPNNPGEDVVKSVLSKMAKPVYLLDITLLTQLRKDGHPSTYTGRGIKFVDCSHWCLAGVPDTWNEILHAALHNE